MSLEFKVIIKQVGSIGTWKKRKKGRRRVEVLVSASWFTQKRIETYGL